MCTKGEAIQQASETDLLNLNAKLRMRQPQDAIEPNPLPTAESGGACQVG